VRRAAMKAIFSGGFLARYAAYSAARAISQSSRMATRADRMRSYAGAALNHRWTRP